MSAVLAPFDRIDDTRERSFVRPALRLLEAPALRVSTLGFVVSLALITVLGLAGVLMLNVRIQERSGQVQKLQTEARQKGYEEALLTSQVQTLRSSTQLQQKAWKMGLRPNPHQVFLVLPDKKIIGNPARVGGGEMTDQKYRSADEVAAAIKKANLKAKRAKATAAERAREKARAERRAAEARRKAEAEKARLDATKAQQTKKTQQTQKTKKTQPGKTTAKPTTGGR